MVKPMLTISQHDAESHFVRPDGVTRTSVLQAIPSYQPVRDAQGVALRFTQPHYFSTALSGALAGVPLWQRIRLKVQGAFARNRAAAVMRRAGMVNGAGLGAYGYGAAYGYGHGYSTDVPYESSIALPSTHGPGQYGLLQANEQMAHVAMRITAGLPPQATMPAVAESNYAAAMRVAPDVTARPAALARMVKNYAPHQVAQAGYGKAIGIFNRLRTWWYG